MWERGIKRDELYKFKILNSEVVMEQDIKKTLKGILEYVGADTKYADYAELQSDLEKLIKRNQVITEVKRNNPLKTTVSKKDLLQLIDILLNSCTNFDESYSIDEHEHTLFDSVDRKELYKLQDKLAC